MLSNMRNALLLAFAFSLVVTGVAYAEGERPDQVLRVVGEITEVVPGQGTFTLQTRRGEELTFQTSDRTRFQGPEDIHDLKKGMWALVVAVEGGESDLLALRVTAGTREDLQRPRRAAGEITAVDLEAASFDLKTRSGETLTFSTGERTRFRSQEGEIDGLDDLEAGMHALVVAMEQEDGGIMALLVAVGTPRDQPHPVQVRGEISGVVPGQGTFTLLTSQGEGWTFETNERTRFRSQDGTVEDIHDLKQGMKAVVIAVERDDEGYLALQVGILSPEDRPPFEHRAAGVIVSIASDAFTIEVRDGSRQTFAVDDNTIYRSRDGSVAGFEDLATGMFVLVGAKESEDGKITASLVAVGRPPGERPGSRPGQEPGGRPAPARPGEDSTSA